MTTRLCEERGRNRQRVICGSGSAKEQSDNHSVSGLNIIQSLGGGDCTVS